MTTLRRKMMTNALHNLGWWLGRAQAARTHSMHCRDAFERKLHRSTMRSEALQAAYWLKRAREEGLA